MNLEKVMFRVVPPQGTTTKPVQDSRTFLNQEKSWLLLLAVMKKNKQACMFIRGPQKTAKITIKPWKILRLSVALLTLVWTRKDA